MGNPNTLIVPDVTFGSEWDFWVSPEPTAADRELQGSRNRNQQPGRRSEQLQGEASQPAAAITAAAGGLAKGLVGFQLILLATAVLGRFWFGGPPMVITGASMEPAVKLGSVVLTEPTNTSGPLPGSIVSFRVDGHTVTHRVVERDGDTLTTRGDANPANDSTQIGIDEVVGAATLVVPFVGLPHLWLRDQRWLPVSAWAGINLFALFLIVLNAQLRRSTQPRSATTVRDRHTRSRRPDTSPAGSDPALATGWG